jgi:hypothetical protein
MESTLMGIAVFGTYDVILKALERRKEYLGETPVFVHAGAGMAAGVARSIFWMSWEGVVHQSNWIRNHPKFCYRTTMHHAVGYGALFGSYQGIRQLLLFFDPFQSSSSIFVASNNDNDKNSNNTLHKQKEQEKPMHPHTIGHDSQTTMTTLTNWTPIGYTVLAGGLAGQIHHLLNHCTTQWKNFRSSSHIPRPPRLYPTMTSFGTMAMCFAAFEHGPEAIDSMLDQVDASWRRILSDSDTD